MQGREKKKGVMEARDSESSQGASDAAQKWERGRLSSLENYIGHYAAPGNNLLAVARPCASQGGRPSSEICGKIWADPFILLAWWCKRLASGGIELIKSLPSLMCFKRIYSILWHQTSRLPGDHFAFVSPPRMFELITAKLHTSGLWVWWHTHKHVHNRTTAYKGIQGCTFLDQTQDSDSASRQFHMHESKLLVFAHWFPVFCVARKHVG